MRENEPNSSWWTYASANKLRETENLTKILVTSSSENQQIQINSAQSITQKQRQTQLIKCIRWFHPQKIILSTNRDERERERENLDGGRRGGGARPCDMPERGGWGGERTELKREKVRETVARVSGFEYLEERDWEWSIAVLYSRHDPHLHLHLLLLEYLSPIAPKGLASTFDLTAWEIRLNRPCIMQARLPIIWVPFLSGFFSFFFLPLSYQSVPGAGHLRIEV